MTQQLECVDVQTEPDPTERTGVGRRFAVLGLASALIGGLSTLLSADPAYARDCQHSPCCDLASCKQCYYQVNPNRFTCPSGYNRTYWTCVSSHITFYCGECVHGHNCDYGPWECSIWYRY